VAAMLLFESQVDFVVFVQQLESDGRYVLAIPVGHLQGSFQKWCRIDLISMPDILYVPRPSSSVMAPALTAAVDLVETMRCRAGLAGVPQTGHASESMLKCTEQSGLAQACSITSAYPTRNRDPATCCEEK